jgi:hypothetical protein
MLVVIMKQPVMQWLVRLNWGSSGYGVLQMNREKTIDSDSDFI